MNQRVSILCVFFILCLSSVVGFPKPLRMDDIHRVMSRLCEFHIENKELSPLLIRRAFKLYIEQFDFEKVYLLESEVSPYLQMSERRAQEIYTRVQAKDYSDFMALNELFQKAILRGREQREQLTHQMLQESSPKGMIQTLPWSYYANSTQDLIQRQQNKMIRFYLFHSSRTSLDRIDRKEKLFSLFEKKCKRAESSYLFVYPNETPMMQDKIEHLISTRILKAFAKSLDTHTAFFSPEEAYEMRLSLEKQFEGVGVILSEGIDGVMIAELIQGSPAAESGRIQVNDLLVEIDGHSVSEASFEEVLELMKHRDRPEMILGFKRIDVSAKTEQFYRVPLKKQPLVMYQDRIQTSYEEVEGGIVGKIVLHSFYENSEGLSSEKDIKEAIRNFRKQGNLKGLVLDLRENSGGFLGQAVRVAGLFVSNGVIVISKYGRGDIHYLRNLSGKSFFEGPLVILTSKMSASAAEIVAQALQDYGVGLVVGDERTFGKGSIQYQTITDANADMFFKVTVGRYYTVSGKSTQIDGVIADIVVPTQYAPYNIGEKYLEYPLTKDQVESAYTDPLSDLDERTQILFQKRYMPHAQKVVSIWKDFLPLLREKSSIRLSKNPHFIAFVKKMEQVRDRQTPILVNTVDEPIHVHMEDLQMTEAVFILKDMISIQETEKDEAAWLPTGSE